MDCSTDILEESESPMQHRVMWKDIRGIRGYTNLVVFQCFFFFFFPPGFFQHCYITQGNE